MRSNLLFFCESLDGGQNSNIEKRKTKQKCEIPYERGRGKFLVPCLINRTETQSVS